MAYKPGTPFYQSPFNVIDLVKPHPSPVYIHMHVRTYDMDKIKWEEENAVQSWLSSRWVEKDQMLETFYNGKGGPLVEGAEEEGATWGDLCVDLLLWAGVQVMMYVGLWRVGGWVLGKIL